MYTILYLPGNLPPKLPKCRYINIHHTLEHLGFRCLDVKQPIAQSPVYLSRLNAFAKLESPGESARGVVRKGLGKANCQDVEGFWEIFGGF